MAGLSEDLIKDLNYEQAINRISSDIRTDFIFAPHYSVIFKYASDDLWAKLKEFLKSGTYNPQLPITIEVPKKSKLTRPGSILNPLDRLLYQCIADEIADEIENSLDREAVFSHRLMHDTISIRMFESPSACYAELKNQITELCNDGTYQYVLVTDIASYFERIYQHVLINLLRSTQCRTEYISLLEKILSALTSKDSHGIIQGVYPSDLLGNYYLSAFDSYLKVNNLKFFRYVDDYWIFFSTLEEAEKALVDMCTYVRKDGLYLNEYKTKIIETQKLHHEETEVDRMFDKAKEEYAPWVGPSSYYDSFEPFEIDYISAMEQEISATIDLYLSCVEDDNLAEKIEKFCLPIFASFKSTVAVQGSINSILQRPHLTDKYSQYLTALFDVDSNIIEEVEKMFLENKLIYEWQMMWILGMFYHSKKLSMRMVDKAYSILIDYNISQAVRAICALIVSKHGDGPKRRFIRNHYSSEPSTYVKEAILYSTKFFPSPDDRNSCIKVWETHSDINRLIALALRKEALANTQTEIEF